MDTNECVLGSNEKCKNKINLLTLVNNDENSVKCKVNEVNHLLSQKKLLLEQPRIEKYTSLSEAEWDAYLKLAKVTKTTKNLTKNFTHALNKSLYLYPEECLCLLEMKWLILWWNKKKLSIKNAYDLLLAKESGCSFEQFRTYGYLVKLGFRVFKHDSNLKKNNYDPNDLIKQSEVPQKNCFKKLKSYDKNKEVVPFSKLKSSWLVTSEPPPCYVPHMQPDYDVYSKGISFPKLKSGWILISSPPQCYLPHNIQPSCDVYAANITLNPNTCKVTEVVFYNKSKDFITRPSSPHKVYDTQPIGVYPVYEKNISKTVKSDKNVSYEPRVKRFKHAKTEKDTIDSKSINEINYCSTSNNVVDLTHTIYDGLNSKEIQQIDSTTNVDISDTKTNFFNNENISTLSNTISENEKFGVQLDIPSNIKQKLFAIKPLNVQNVSMDYVSNNDHYVYYDVYYPNNKFAKTSRPAPDFRVIIFKDDINTFPNIYNVSVSNPNDNVTTLWAIINSTTVSFYNVNNIDLPKSSKWKT